MGRALAALWGLSLAAVAGLVFLLGQLVSSSPAPRTGTPAGASAPRPASTHPGTAPAAWGGWNLVDRLSAHNVLILTVETDRLDDAVVIAQHLVERREHTYVEIMVYFHRPGQSEAPPARRVQWTPSDGYVETNLEEYY